MNCRSVSFPQSKKLPLHLSVEIASTVTEQQRYASAAFLSSYQARMQEAKLDAAVAAADVAHRAEAERIRLDELKVRKEPSAFHNSFRFGSIVTASSKLLFFTQP